MAPEIANLLYLAASICFILGLKGLTHPRSAQRGNTLGAFGMLLAIVTALASETHLNWGIILTGLAVGGGIGAFMALTLEMTAMPQMVALLNGFGGGASVLVASTALIRAAQAMPGPEALTRQLLIASAASVIIGAVTLLGSLVAFAKLREMIKKRLIFSAQQLLNAALALGCIGCGVMLVLNPGTLMWFWLMVGLAAFLGILLVAPIGGADMPVVIAVLNSYSGMAACATGFVLNNNVLVISGSLVGASGLILTRIMCRAMNRSFTNVIFGLAKGAGAGPSEDEVYAGKIKSTSAEEVVMILETARRVVIVPGYGMAVAQAQHAVRDLAGLLEARDITVDFAIHPVAGRMPGHMNVLLAEADIGYDKLKDMDAINPTMDQADVAIVIGANDVVNPAARQSANSPIAGMPILDVDKARTVIVIKRSLSPGFAGIPNPLFAAENTLMLFDDGKKALIEINTALKEV